MGDIRVSLSELLRNDVFLKPVEQEKMYEFIKIGYAVA